MKSASTSYAWPIVASVLLHGALVAFIAIGWSPADKPRKVVTPQYVEAKLLVMAPVTAQPQAKPKAEPQPKPAPPPPPPPKDDSAERQRQEQQRKQEEQRKQEQQRQEAVRQEQARKEQVRREQEAKAKAEAEKKRKEEQAEAERKRQEELKRQQAERERQERVRREQELARALAAEQALADAAASEEQVGSYIGYIQNRIGANWSRPPSARLGMVTELEITLDGQARVVGVAVVKSSGNAAFDLSAEQAVRRAEQFERLRELIQQDRAAYEQNFRRFRLVFNPQDLRL